MKNLVDFKSAYRLEAYEQTMYVWRERGEDLYQGYLIDPGHRRTTFSVDCLGAGGRMRGRHQHVRGDEPSRTPLIRLHWQLLSCGPTCSAEDPRTRPARKLHPGRNKINDSRFGANDGKEDDQSRILLDHLSDRDTNLITIKMGNRISALLIKQDLKGQKVSIRA